VPSTNNSSIVVLEGDYTSYENYTQISTEGNISLLPNGELALPEDGVGKITEHKSFNPKLSLLEFNSQTTFAFSDRLIEYLLLNVIYPGDALYENIERIQRAFCELDEKTSTLEFDEKAGGLVKKSQYNNYAKYMNSRHNAFGLWDDALTEVIKKFVENSRKKYSIRDADTNVNIDIEKILMWEGIRY
jgi:hypothetical protein